VDGSLRWIYASDEAMVFIRENSKQSVLVVATRGKDDEIEFPLDAAVGLDKAERLYGSAKLGVGKKKAKISAGKVELTVWRLPAAK
jgi:alpha-glucosidase